MYEINESQIRQWWQLFNPQGKLVEIRLLGKATYSGYFRDIDTLIAQLRPLLDHNNYQYYGAMQAYFLRGYEERVAINSFPSDCMKQEEADVFLDYFGEQIRGRMIIENLEYPYFSPEHWKEKSRSVKFMDNLLAADDFGTGIPFCFAGMPGERLHPDADGSRSYPHRPRLRRLSGHPSGTAGGR